MTEYDKKWNRQYKQLVEFKRTNGHCVVPQRNKEHRSLGVWVSTQRTIQKSNKIRLDRKDILDKIGFAWKPDGAHTLKQDDKLWHQQHEKLLEYKRKNGHCKVPNKYKDDKSLGIWVYTQRKNHNDNKMRQDRKRVLDEIGFAWKPDAGHNFKLDAKHWHQQYEKLLEYKRKNGHCKVPQTKNKDDKTLGWWVSTQRKRHANNKMLPDRKELLDANDFVWKIDYLATHSSTTDVRCLAI
jgi:hypothetical protein